jgi:multidrug efflux pump subunit AcrA (membrane-fusion protein)
METEVDVENKDLSIAPGMYANTALQLAQARNVVTIPVEALVLNAQNRQTVYVLDANNRVHIRAVKVGLQGSKLAQIISSVDAGDRVLIGGQEKYQEGEAVNPLITAEPASETVQESGGMIDMTTEQDAGGTH